MPMHDVSGPATVLCIEGEATLTIEGREEVFAAGNLAYVPESTDHQIKAKRPSAFLITIGETMYPLEGEPR
jgi:quercetin dioxygenase-like cupin family protein